MATKYVCSNPEHPEHKHSKYYDRMTLDGLCPDCGPLEMGILMPVEEGGLQPLGAQIGLCTLVCDASGSMTQDAFPPNPLRKIDLVARAAAMGIADLYSITKPDFAYIALIAFGAEATQLTDRAGNPFLKSISEIQQTFPTSEELRVFLIDALTSGRNVDSNYTNITKALTLAREIDQGARRGDLQQFGLNYSFQLMPHVIRGGTTTVPNVRTLIYSDGQHNPSDGTPLSNPWAGDEISTLMSVFFGSEEDKGAVEMKSLACLCPIQEHKKHPGFFLINSPERYQTLRYLFRMASGTSGFCPQCLKDQMSVFVGARPGLTERG